MSLLRGIFGSDSKLTSPDFSSSSKLELPLGNRLLKLRDADHSAMAPINAPNTGFDIFDESQYEECDFNCLAHLFYEKAWSFYGRSSEAKGGVHVTAGLYFYRELRTLKGLLDKRVMEEKILELCHGIWGWQNEGAVLGNIGDGRYQYPIDPSELTYKEINSISWVHFTTFESGNPPKMEYVTPITEAHMLVIGFTLSAYRGLDFFSPETNLKDTAYGVVEDFMQHVYIEDS